MELVATTIQFHERRAHKIILDQNHLDQRRISKCSPEEKNADEEVELLTNAAMFAVSTFSAHKRNKKRLKRVSYLSARDFGERKKKLKKNISNKKGGKA